MSNNFHITCVCYLTVMKGGGCGIANNEVDELQTAVQVSFSIFVSEKLLDIF